MKVQLLYFPGCPNVDAARDVLRRALVGRRAIVQEIDTTATSTPERLRGWGSPTILVDGIDVADEKPSGQCCRLYLGAEVRGAPSEAVIRAALDRARGHGVWRSLALLPGALVSILPTVTCPACLAGYAALLSSSGLGFLFKARVQVPLIVAFLSLGIVAIAWSTRSHRRTGPLIATIAGSAAVVIGRLVVGLQPATYAGVALLVVASLWNLWLKRPRRQSPLLAAPER
jgi:mercuric ion transport protein